MEILKIYDASLRLLMAKNKLHEDKRARVIIPDEDIEYFELISVTNTVISMSVYYSTGQSIASKIQWRRIGAGISNGNEGKWRE